MYLNLTRMAFTLEVPTITIYGSSCVKLDLIEILAEFQLRYTDSCINLAGSRAALKQLCSEEGRRGSQRALHDNSSEHTEGGPRGIGRINDLSKS